MQSGTKNPPWARSSVNSNMTGMNSQMMDASSMGMPQQGMMPYQNSQAVYNPSMMQQSSMGMPMGGQMPINQMAQNQMYPGNVVAYPAPRGMNPGMYQNQANQSQPATNEQRVFTGTVTKTHNDFGFVDHDVFYQTSVCAKGINPKLNDRVLVEATYNPNMPFKWNATRVQVLPKGGPQTNKPGPRGGERNSNYNAVPPPSKQKNMTPRRDDRPMRREDRKRSRTRSPSRSRPERRRDSPARKRPTTHARSPSPVTYLVRVPRVPLEIPAVDVPGLTQRYSNLYIPSDFFSARIRWVEAFPPQSPFPLNNSCTFHIMSKEVENPLVNDAVLEPPDADYRFSAKVMLISMPSMESLYQKCGLTKSDEKDKDKRGTKSTMHPTRLIKFLVGQKGKGGENFAIGGPWSPSLDGEDPENDPTVLVRTAIRTCKALTGIDLNPCTQWYRVVEFHYWRECSGGRSRLETVVLLMPDVWSAQPTRVDWPDVQERYKAACEAHLRQLEAPKTTPAATPAPADPDAATPDSSQIDINQADESTITIDENDDEEKPAPTHHSKLDLKTIKVEQLRQELLARGVSNKGLRPQLLSRLTKLVRAEEENDKKSEEVLEISEEEGDKAAKPAEKTTEDKDNKADTEKKDSDKKDSDKKDSDKKDSDKKVEKDKEEVKEKSDKEKEEEKKKLEREKQSIKSRYELPNAPHIMVHASTAAKGGKFTCSIATLSLLLDYRVSDNKEHSFELFVFAELFNEMMMRDFGFYVYKTLFTLPEKVEEPKPEKKDDKVEKKDDKAEKKDDKAEKKDDKTEKKDDKAEKKDDKAEKKDDKKDEKTDKKDDKREDRKDSRRRDRRDSHSDDERSVSASHHKSRGVDLPPDPYLLLSLIYFDTSRCGYLRKKDLQNLFMSLGLQLSRSQIRSVVDKVCVKDNFTYKPLIQAIKDLASGSAEMMQDLPLETTIDNTEVPAHIAELEAQIAAGNRNLLPVFGRSNDSEGSSGGKEVGDNGMVTYKSRLVDIGATLTALERSEALRARLESALGEARAVARTMRAAAAQTQAASKSSQHQLTDLSASLARANQRIASLTSLTDVRPRGGSFQASTKIFHAALKTIQSKVDAVVNIKYEEDDDVVEVVNGAPKLEDKKDVKSDAKSETKSEMEETKPENATSTDKDASGKTAISDIVQTENMEIDDKE